MSDRHIHPRALLDWLTIDRTSPEAIYRQITAQLQRAIIDGRLPPGTVLPASRTLASTMGVSRNTALQAYDLLIAEGCLEAVAGSGTRVAARMAEAAVPDQIQQRFLQPHTHAGIGIVLPPDAFEHEPPVAAFRPGIPAFDAFPRRLWARLLNAHALRGDPTLLDYTYPGGDPRLREELSRYLTMSRGVRCQPEQVIIVGSNRAACSLIAHVLLTRGATVAVEDPGYLAVKRILSSMGLRVFLLPVDDGGARIGALVSNGVDCQGVYLTPTHQWPTGASLTTSRRVSLLQWAKHTGAWIFEDDYDGVFHFDGAPPPALYSLANERVIFLGGFSKVLAPSIRTAYLVVPPSLVRQFETHAYRLGIEPPLHVQAALADFLADGHFVRHIAAMRKLYGRRRALLSDALTRHFGDSLVLRPAKGGLQILADLPVGVSARAVSRAATAARLVARPLHAYQIAGTVPETIQFGFAAVPEVQIAPAVIRLHRAVKGCL